MASDFIAHGGDLALARSRFGDGRWQDLSTGISPWSWPVPEVPASVWRRLPETSCDLRRAAARYYGVAPEQALPVPGSQFAIARLPHGVPPGSVALPDPGYAEHARAWCGAGHRPEYYRDLDHLEALIETGAVNHAVVISPNNPTGEVLSLERLRRCRDRLTPGGVLLVDEAFADLSPDASATALLQESPGLWVVRSLGKFFGLAGLRLGFLLGEGAPAQKLLRELEPWGVSHPAQWLGERALADEAWQRCQRRRLRGASRRLEALWRDALGRLPLCGATVSNGGLFVTVRGHYSELEALHRRLATHKLWLRLGGERSDPGQGWLRCGLPSDDGERLGHALAQCACHDTAR